MNDYQSVTSDFQFHGLYEWQQQALLAWKQHNFRGVVEAVTGAGKTRVGIAAVAQALRLGMKVTILVPTTELQDQWVASLRKDLPRAVVGRLGGTQQANFRQVDVLVAIINSASTRSVIENFRSGLVVADECHRYAAAQFSRALEDAYGWRLGLTATYSRTDGQQEVLDTYFGSVVYRIWYDEAQRYGVISKFDIALVGIQLLPHEQSEYEDISEKIAEDTRSLKNYVDDYGLDDERFMEAVVRLTQLDDGTAAGPIARRYLKNVSDRQALLAKTPVKNHALAALAPALASSERALVFGSNKDQAHVATETLQAVGLSAGYLMSGMTKVDRLGTMNAFRRGELQVLCAPRVLDEGVDVPAADVAIQTSGTKVQRQFIQRLGRIIRQRLTGDRGRFVYLYAFGTIEDPALQEDFLPDVLPFSRMYMYFDLAKHLDDLLEFLAPETPVAPQESNQMPGPSGAEPVQPVEEPTDLDLAEPQWNDIPAEDDEGFIEQLGAVPISEDAVGDYLRMIGRFPLLEHEVMVELAQQVEAGLYAQYVLEADPTLSRRQRRPLWEIEAQGQRAFHSMLNANLRLVVSVAKRYVGGWEEPPFAFLDLVQEGNLGLLRAVQLWDYRRGFQFSTYAHNWIRQAIGRSLADQSRTIRIPVHVNEGLWKVRSIQRELIAQNLEPTDQAVGRKMKEPAARVRQLLEAESIMLSLSSDYWIGGLRYELGDVIVDHMALDGGDLVIEQCFRRALRAALDAATLYWPQRDQAMCYLRWGITTHDRSPATLQEVGEAYGVSRERVRQIVKQRSNELAENAGLHALWQVQERVEQQDSQHEKLQDELIVVG